MQRALVPLCRRNSAATVAFHVNDSDVVVLCRENGT